MAGHPAALPPSSTSLSVPLTQNTAPVIKFQCLFTRDVRRKAKRWQDGFLRFHTFNKRVMVYELSGIFIGDLHWQGNAELQDGDELELEQGGVLVQVGECLERTQADLTPLLEKRKGSTTTSAPMIATPRTTAATLRTPVASPPRPANVAPSQPSGEHQPVSDSIVRYPADRLKPLSEVLGKQRGTIGRAAFPEKSPYEQRHGGHDNFHLGTERPSKRHKRSRDLDTGDESYVQRNAADPSEACNRPTSRGNYRGINARPSESTLCDVPSFQPASTVKVSNEKESSASRRRKSPDKEPGRQQQRSITNLFPADSAANSLHFPAQKPRNKLMCKELLSASSSSDKKGNPQQEPSVAHKIRDRAKSSKANNMLRDTAVHRENADDTCGIDKSSVLTPTDGNSTLEFIPSASMLQALEEAGAPPSSQRDSVISDFFKPCKPEPSLRQAGNETTTDENLDPQASTVLTSRSLIRSHSDTRSDAAASTTTISNSTSLLPSDANTRQQQRPLQKSHSDVSSLRTNGNAGGSSFSRSFQPKLAPMMTMTTVNDNLASPCTGDDNGERGPWSSEALDLFDWWPPGRPKPAANAKETGQG